METKTQHGYLVLADISGYTSFLAGTELEHAHEVLTELLELILHRLTPTMTLAKIEGDAVFVYAPATRFTHGEALLDLIETTYVAFRERTQNMYRRTTCTCSACRAIPTLDLKFFTHHGDFIVQHILDRQEFVGTDVNLAHRLMKNHVTEATGWRGYALYTRRLWKGGAYFSKPKMPIMYAFKTLMRLRRWCGIGGTTRSIAPNGVMGITNGVQVLARMVAVVSGRVITARTVKANRLRRLPIGAPSTMFLMKARMAVWFSSRLFHLNRSTKAAVRVCMIT